MDMVNWGSTSISPPSTVSSHSVDIRKIQIKTNQKLSLFQSLLKQGFWIKIQTVRCACMKFGSHKGDRCLLFAASTVFAGSLWCNFFFFFPAAAAVLMVFHRLRGCWETGYRSIFLWTLMGAIKIVLELQLEEQLPACGGSLPSAVSWPWQWHFGSKMTGFPIMKRAVCPLVIDSVG